MNKENHYLNIQRLWIFRLFETSWARNRLLIRRGYRDDDIATFLNLPPENPLDEEDFNHHEIRQYMSKAHASLEGKKRNIQMPQLIQHNFDRLGKIIRLNSEETSILQFIAVSQTESIFSDTFNVLNISSVAEFVKAMARALRLSQASVAKALSPKGHLVQSGLLLRKGHNRPLRLPGLFSSSLAESLLTESFDSDKLLREIVTPAPPPTLTYGDYPHIKEDLALLRPYLRKMLKNGNRGVNFYIHGMPGTGKSELARVLGREMRCSVLELSSEDNDGDPISPKERLNALRMANSLLATRTLLVFDEAEDIFNDGSVFSPSTAQIRKAWMNRMLETNAIPTIWISNSIRGLDPANVRRFDFVFELSNPPRKQRERTYRKICSDIVSPDTINRIAKTDRLAPAVVARATKVVKSLQDTLPVDSRDAAFERLIDNTLKAQGNRKGLGKSQSSELPKVYNIAYLNCEADLQKVGESLTRLPSCRVCLYGPPGTGKTSFAHWIARTLGRPLHAKRASDILSPYIGMTEQNFAKVFERAHEEGAILLLDEVDTFLQDRRQAVRSWEVSQVNEMLTQMEAFDGIFFASTNLMDNLDQAALRRFDLKLYFDYLKPEQAVDLFRAHCKSLQLGNPTLADLNRAGQITTLTPGDFANVARQHPFRNFSSPAEFLESAASECKLKGVSANGALGFG